ncbi:MAG TPA: DUF2203 family protein [Myxococcota bacterium]|jgi:hypothetical protein|nr:DUF2203 family protein [Myxococcota bacterium]
MEETGRRAWTLAAARALMSDVRSRTERAVHESERLFATEGAAPDAAQREAIAAEVDRIVSRWAREMEALGLEVKGLWLVDFDNGNGYFCWKWPEPELAYFHGYDEGFAGRSRIQ